MLSSSFHQVVAELTGVDHLAVLTPSAMDDDQLSAPGTPVSDGNGGGTTPGNPEQTPYDKQLASLRTFLASVPYECESVEDMELHLANIVDKLHAVTLARLWHLLPGWNELLVAWLRLRYPIKKEIRARLLTYYYEVSLIPGLPLYIVSDTITMFSQLASNKSGTQQIRYVDAKDLQLDWKPLWRVLRKEIWPWKRLSDLSQNKANLFLYLAECSKYYYPPTEIPNMLETFIPLITKSTILAVFPTLTSFLPMRCVDQYLPALFAIFEGFNSHVIDARMIEFAGDLSEDHVAGLAGEFGEEGMRWRDVGVWTQDQWTFLIGKCLGNMNLPMGSTKGSHNTGAVADALGDRNSTHIKKAVNIGHSFAKFIVYSMAVDGPVRSETVTGSEKSKQKSNGPTSTTSTNGFLAGSKGLDSLSKIITSAETYFHPSNSGAWTLNLANFLHRLATEFCKRWKEEQESKCKVPMTQRLTSEIRRQFVITLRTPALLSLFAKDPISMGMAQAALRTMALLEPNLIMPQLLERAYSGLEVVNETHRTTAVLSMLSCVALPLVSSRIWLGGQKHLVPLLDLCLPGIDLNDPTKTICATMFICAAIQHIKVGDLSIHAASGTSFLSDEGTAMDVDGSDSQLPLGQEGGAVANGLPVYSKEEERALTRDSTAGFADWLVSLFRRVFALYENLPEEGGKRNTTGGKQEESVLKSIKNTLDVVCLHLSDTLFDLVLKVVYEYATTNAKSNSVRAFGQLIACLARVKPEETLDKFLPFCTSQILEELKHGASSERTNSSHAAAPSDTTLHWNMSILRGCLGYGGPALVKHKEAILNLVDALVDKTKSERGYSSTGRLLTRILHTLSGVYPLNCRFVNLDEWNNEDFDQNHDLHWGRMYHAGDIKIEWHVPNEEEIAFILEILDRIADPLSTRLFALLKNTPSWDNVARNDFCRFLYALRAIWAGLPTLIQEIPEKHPDPCLKDEESLSDLIPTALPVKAGFALTDPQEARYQSVLKHRRNFGQLVHAAAVALQGNVESEDQVDAIVGVAKAIEVYLLEYAVTQSSYVSLAKNYHMAKEANRAWPRQKENSRLVFLKRAQVYHTARLSLHGMNRRRSDFDVFLFNDLIDLSLSPYTRLRRYGQSVLLTVCSHFKLARSSVYPPILKALVRGSDPDRMKGALYVLSNKGIASLARSEQSLLSSTFTALLECQHQEKPSVQKLVATVHHDLLKLCGNEDTLQSAKSYHLDKRILEVLDRLRGEFPGLPINSELTDRAEAFALGRSDKENAYYEQMVNSIVEIAKRPATHWRYLQMAIRCLISVLRRDVPPPPAVGLLLAEVTTKTHPATRTLAQRGMVKLLALVKVRSFSTNLEQAWLEEWTNPLSSDIPIPSVEAFVESLRKPFNETGNIADSDVEQVYVDKLDTGFVAWTPTVKGYRIATEDAPLSSTWEQSSRPALSAIDSVLRDDSYFGSLLSLWSQEAESKKADLDLRPDNVVYVKTLAKMFEQAYLNQMIANITPLLSDADRFKQRAGAEFLAGLLRGSKHWPLSAKKYLQDWFMGQLGVIFAHIRPDTIHFWEESLKQILDSTDPMRNPALIDWLLALSFDFNTDSAFTSVKTLIMFSTLVDAMKFRMADISSRYTNTLFENFDTNYAEIRSHLAGVLNMLLSSEWNPWYPSVSAFLTACKDSLDPLGLRAAPHLRRIEDFVEKLPKWKEERLAPPRVGQSQYDKVSLSLLTWIWTEGHGSNASSVFPYVLPILPEILRMTELSDNPDLQTYSSAALFVISAVTPPREFIAKVADALIYTIKSSSSWKIRLNGLPVLMVFFYKNLLSFTEESATNLMDVVIECLSDENVEVREMAAKILSGLLRCSQRQSIIPLRNRFVADVRRHKLPRRQDAGYVDSLRALHSAILGICALVESFPYSVEPWMPPLTEVLAPHASDPPPISTTIRKCASEFKKTHQDTWHEDQQAFDEDQSQALSNMLIGTSYYA